MGKSWKKRVTVARKELCKAISATNGEEACKSSLFSNKKNKIELYVYTLCDKACTPYFKGKKIEIDEKDCKYAKPPKPGPVPPVEPDPVPPPVPDPVPDPVPPPTPGPPDPIVDIIKKFPTEYLKVCSTIKTGETILWDKKVLCAFELFEKRYETPKCLLCPEVCNDKKVAFSTKVADKTPTNMNKMKSLKKRVTVARKELCKAISATNGEAACKSSLFSNKKTKSSYMYIHCVTRHVHPTSKEKKSRS